MDDKAELYLQRAENELIASQILFDVSYNQKIQQETFKLEKEFTFYSSVIGHAYYCIFYSAKAILMEHGIKTSSPDVHKRTIDAFEEHLVKTGKLDVELLVIYQKMMVRAEELLEIFIREKKKRGEFTYQKLPQANKDPAKQSFESASLFFKHVNKILRK